ncbi:sodium-independent sulfate anion transporter-like isoform X2 [Contarinia nasturtii]|uniref:sodium-independent sulfate anion transporter-like isoform X2 n=1 Tax=Contarinia nasturtii TaxID=265458 RepID=UPI0012D42080|nr:sodium-independent sulfate anion transporter-like isoform X2 [Contarinia nasturtii]
MATPFENSIDDVSSIAVQQRTDYSNDYSEQWPPVCSIFVRNMRRMHNDRKKILMNRLPVLKWVPSYRPSYLFYDFIAGLTVGLTAIPQGIAYAIVAGLPPQYGLYSGFIGSFVYLIFGSCKDVTIGPTAILSLLIQRYVAENIDFAIFLTLVNGALIFIFGMLNLGFLVQFISVPVTVGFTTAAAMTIGSSQVKSLLGIKGSANGFIESWMSVVTHIQDTKLWDTLLGATTIIVLLLLKNLKYKKNLRDVEPQSIWKNECKKYLSLGRNAIVVIFGTILAYVLNIYGKQPFTLTGRVASGLPDIKVPPMQTTIGNETLYTIDMITHVGSSIIALPLISILESIAVAKAFSKGKTIDATQEMLALGLCNLIGAFFQSMPVTGSFTRTAVNNASGVRTTLGGIFTGCLVLLSLGFLTDSFRFIPKTTLAGVIICAMMFMVDKEDIKEIWRSKRIDIIPFICTLIACLMISIEFGIIIGIAINISFVLYTIARPVIHVYNRKIMEQELLILMPDQSLTFSSSDHFKYKILKYVVQNTPKIVIIDGRFIHNIDATVAKSLCTVVEDMHLLHRKVYFWHWNKEPMGVLCRLNSKMFALFKDAQTEDELLKSVSLENGKEGTAIRISADT